MTNITNLADELKLIENRNFCDMDEKSCLKYLEAFHKRIKNLSLWKKLDNYDEFFAITTLTDAFFEENEQEKKENIENWYRLICNSNLDMQYLIVLYLFNNIQSVFNFYIFLSKSQKIDCNSISIVLMHRCINLLTRNKGFPIKYDDLFKKDVEALLDALNSNEVFFSAFYALLSNIWVFNTYTAYYENIRYAFIDRLLNQHEPKCSDVIYSDKWDKTKSALYSRIIIYMSLNSKSLSLREKLYNEIIDFVSREKYIQLKIGDGTNDSDLLLTIASFLADDDDCYDKIKNSLNINMVQTYGSMTYDVNYRAIERQCYFYSAGAFASQMLVIQKKYDKADKLYNFLLDSFNEYIAYNIPDGYDTPLSFSAVPNAISAMWLNMSFFSISEEKIISSLEAIKNLDNKILAAYAYFDKTNKQKGENAISQKVKDYINDIVPIAENWFSNAYANKNVSVWRQKLLHDVKEVLKND